MSQTPISQPLHFIVTTVPRDLQSVKNFYVWTVLSFLAFLAPKKPDFIVRIHPPIFTL